MSIGGPVDAEIAKLFDPRYIREVYKNPDEHIKKVKDIMERNTVCPSCGRKEIEVLSVEERKAKCKSCGHELE